MLVETLAAIHLKRLLHEQSRPFKVRYHHLHQCNIVLYDLIYSFDTIYDLCGQLCDTVRECR